MFGFKKKSETGSVPMGQAVTAIVAVLALFIAIGAARWSWYTVEELIMLRQDFNELKNGQEQLKIQFDYWDQKVSAERMQLRKMMNGGTLTPPQPAP
ncbi:MAG TPA: hypothetical protein VL500_04075 [Candidatus Eisenbacteria bacterium]|nr:hypothetical protein [Candidatus Eisenbacteria bacterium]